MLCTGRRVGKTQIMAIKAAERMRAKPNQSIIIASLTEDQAKLIILMILQYLEENYPKEISKRAADKPTQNRIKLKNGSTALARPVGTTGDALRGFNGHVLILDEASRFNKLIMEAATPLLLTTGGEIWMASTPFGKQGFFWEMFNQSYNLKDPEARFKVFYKTSVDVITNRPISDSWSEKRREKALKHLEKERKDKTEKEFGQEYLGLFLEDLQQFFEEELIQKCCTLRRPSFPVKTGKNYMGCDLARMGGDQNTREIINDPGYFPLIHVESIAKKKELTPVTERNIIETAKLWNVKKVGIDAGAGTLGVSILDHLRESEIKHKVVPINNRTVVVEQTEKNNEIKDKVQRFLKEDLYFQMKAAMERGELLLLFDQEVMASLRSVQIEYPEEDDALRRARIFGKHTHIVEGLVRAYHLAKKEKSLNLWAK